MKIEDAEQAVAEAIAAKADEASVEELGTLAHAVSELRHGPQGGNYESSASNENRNATDYHYTTHDGDARSRPTGFAP